MQTRQLVAAPNQKQLNHVRLIRGSLHARIGDNDKAASDFTKAAELEPDNYSSHLGCTIKSSIQRQINWSGYISRSETATFSRHSKLQAAHGWAGIAGCSKCVCE